MLRLVSLTVMTFGLIGCSGQQIVNALTPSWGYQRATDIAYGPLPRQKLDIYVPDAAGNAPVVVFFYGGRWSSGNKEGYKFVAQALTSRGYVVMVPDYRLYPAVTFPSFVQDAAKAVAWAHAHSAEYSGDPGKLFVMGHSAGAYIAAMLATNAAYLRAVGGSVDWLAGMIGLAGPYDFLPITAEDLQEIFAPRSQWPATQPVHFVNGNEPPILLLHGGADQTVEPRNSKSLARLVRQAGGRAEVIIYPGVSHIGLIAKLAAPLRWTGSQLADIATFINAIVYDGATSLPESD